MTTTRTATAFRILVATPLAAAALTVGGFAGLAGAAHADGEPAGPGTIVLPLPDPDPHPQPGPQIPGDKDGPNPGDGPRPEGPGEIAIPDPQDKPGKPDKPGQKGTHGEKPQRDAGPTVEVRAADVPVPTRIDAGAGAAPADGLELGWLLAGGGLVTAAGSALAGRRLARR